MSLSATNLAFSGRGVGERKLDSVVHAHSQLYVVAQSNAGVHGFSNYGTAKNSLAVGAVQDFGIIAGFSSHGPTADGRLRPNVVGTGVRLTSARGGASVSGHNTLSGTSMASPSVAGVAALLMEARPEFQNRPALTRARLMASAIRPDAYLASRAQLPADNTDGPGAFNNLYGTGPGVRANEPVFARRSTGLAHWQRDRTARQRHLRIHRHPGTAGSRPAGCSAHLGRATRRHPHPVGAQQSGSLGRPGRRLQRGSLWRARLALRGRQRGMAVDRGSGPPESTE